MDKVIINEAFEKLNEESERSDSLSEVKRKVRNFLEQFYENWLEEEYVDSGAQTTQIMNAVPEYNPDWCPDEYIEELSIIDEHAFEKIIEARVDADMKSLFLNAQNISEASDQLNQISKSRRRLTEAEGNMIRNGYDGWDFVAQVAQEEISSGDYENKAEFVSSITNFLEDSIDDLDKDDINDIRIYLKQVWDQWQVAD